MQNENCVFDNCDNACVFSSRILSQARGVLQAENYSDICDILQLCYAHGKYHDFCLLPQHREAKQPSSTKSKIKYQTSSPEQPSFASLTN